MEAEDHVNDKSMVLAVFLKAIGSIIPLFPIACMPFASLYMLCPLFVSQLQGQGAGCIPEGHRLHHPSDGQ